jgi:Zn-dependent protease
MLAGFAVVGLGVGWLFGRLLRVAEGQFNITVPDWPLLITGSLIAFIATLCLHELGHLVGGWLVGFRFMLFIVGPLKIVREGEVIRARLNRDISLAGGLASAMPSDDYDLGRRMAVLIAGGPLTSLLLAVLSLGLAVWLNDPAPSGSAWSVGAFFAVVLGMTNLAIGVVTLIPGKTSGFDTDGAQLLDYLRGGQRGERRLLIAALAAASTRGTRPRALNAAQVERLLALRTNSKDEVMANYLGYYHRLDRGEVKPASELLDLALEHITGLPEAARPALLTEAAYFTAAHRRDAGAARKWLAQAQGGMVETHTRLRAEAAVLLAEGKSVEAAETARAGLETVSRSVDQGGAIAERDWLEALLNEAHDYSARHLKNAEDAPSVLPSANISALSDCASRISVPR